MPSIPGIRLRHGSITSPCGSSTGKLHWIFFPALLFYNCHSYFICEFCKQGCNQETCRLITCFMSLDPGIKGRLNGPRTITHNQPCLGSESIQTLVCYYSAPNTHKPRSYLNSFNVAIHFFSLSITLSLSLFFLSPRGVTIAIIMVM